MEWLVHPPPFLPPGAADDVEEIQQAVRTAIQACCLQLKSKIAKQQAAREQRQRKKNLTKYIPNVAAALMPVLEALAERQEGAAAGAFVASVCFAVHAGDGPTGPRPAHSRIF